jgi:transposase-like protein
LEVEVEAYLERHRQERDGSGRALVVRNGQARERRVTVGSGTFAVRAPRVNDQRVIDGERQKFTSEILPPYLRRSKAVTEVLPVLYLRGLSTGDFREGLAALLGENAAGLSPSAITRLTSSWQAECEKLVAAFTADYEPKYPKAAKALATETDKLMTHFEMPAEHWKHLRTTNPIERDDGQVTTLAAPRTVKRKNGRAAA